MVDLWLFLKFRFQRMRSWVLRCIHLYKCRAATPSTKHCWCDQTSAPVVFWLQTDVFFLVTKLPLAIIQATIHPFTVTLIDIPSFLPSSAPRFLVACGLSDSLDPGYSSSVQQLLCSQECWHLSSSPVQRIPVSHQMRLGEWDVWMIWWFFEASYVVMWFTAGRHTRKSISSHMYITLWIMHVYYFILCICVHI